MYLSVWSLQYRVTAERDSQMYLTCFVGAGLTGLLGCAAPRHCQRSSFQAAIQAVYALRKLFVGLGRENERHEEGVRVPSNNQTLQSWNPKHLFFILFSFPFAFPKSIGLEADFFGDRKNKPEREPQQRRRSRKGPGHRGH